MTEIGDYCMEKEKDSAGPALDGYAVWRKDKNPAQECWWFASEKRALDFIDERNKKEAK